MDKDTLTRELGAAIIVHPKVAALPWQRYALVARIDAQQSSLHGFAFDADGGYQMATPTGFEIHDKLRALCEAMSLPVKRPGERAWCVLSGPRKGLLLSLSTIILSAGMLRRSVWRTSPLV